MVAGKKGWTDFIQKFLKAFFILYKNQMIIFDESLIWTFYTNARWCLSEFLGQGVIICIQINILIKC